MSIICESPEIIKEVYDNTVRNIDRLVGSFENLFKTIAVPDLKYPFLPLDYSWFLQTILKFLQKFNIRMACELGLATAIELRRYQAIKTNESYIKNFEKSPNDLSAQRQVEFGEFYEDKINEAVQLLKDKNCIGSVPFGLLSGLCDELIRGLTNYIESTIDDITTEFEKALFLNDASKAFAVIAGLIQTIFDIVNSMITDFEKLIDIFDCIYLTQKTLTLSESNFKDFQQAIEEDPTKEQNLAKELLNFHETNELSDLRKLVESTRATIPSVLRIFDAYLDIINEGREIWYKHMDGLRNACQVQYQKENISPVIKNSIAATGGYDISEPNQPTESSNKTPVFDSQVITKDDTIININYIESLSNNVSDPDEDILTFTKTEGPAWLNISSDGDLTGTPAILNLGINTWIIRVTDLSGAFSEAKLVIKVTKIDNSDGNRIASGSSSPNTKITKTTNRGLSESTFQNKSSSIDVNIILNKKFDISYEDSKNNKLVTYNLLHVPILLFNLMTVYNINDGFICLSELITNINTIDLDKLTDQLLLNSESDDPDSSLIFRDGIQSIILPFLIDYSGPTIGQLLNTHTVSTINIISDIIENYYYFGAINLAEFLNFAYGSEDTIREDIKNKLICFIKVINEFDSICVFGKNQSLEQLYITYFGLSRTELLLQLLNLFTCDQTDITSDKYRLLSINNLINLLMNNNSQISSDITTKFTYLYNILVSEDLSSLNSWITTLRDNLASLGSFTPTDNQTVINSQAYIFADTLKLIAGNNYPGILGNDIYIKVRKNLNTTATIIKEDVDNRIVTITIGTTIADESIIGSAISSNNITLINISGIGIISNFKNYKLNNGVNQFPHVMCGNSQNITNNDTFLEYLIEFITVSGCDLNPNTLTHNYVDLTLSYCLSGTEARYHSIHEYQLDIINAISSDATIDGVYYTSIINGNQGNYIQISVANIVGPIVVSVSGSGLISDPYIILCECDISNTYQVDVREAINNYSQASDLVTATGGSKTITASITTPTSLDGGLDGESISTFEEWVDLDNDKIKSTLVTDNEDVLTISDDNESQFGFIDVTTDIKFPISEYGFKVFLPEGCSGIYIRLKTSNFQEIPYIIGKYRYSPTRYEVERYNDYTQQPTLKTIKDRTVFTVAGDSQGLITVLSNKGLPLMIDGWLYILPIGCGIDNIEIQVLYYNDYYLLPKIENDVPIQTETIYTRHDWYGQICYICGGTSSDNNVSDLIYKFSISNPQNATSVSQLEVSRQSATSVSDGENILIIGGNNGVDDLESIEIFKGDFESAILFSEISSPRRNLASASNGNVFIISGGLVSDIETDLIEYGKFNTATSIKLYGSLSSVRSYHSGCSNGIAAIFSGGYSNIISDIYRDDYELTDELSGFGIGYESTNTGLNIIETFCINNISEIIDFADLNSNRYNHTSACNSEHVLFAGGIGDNGILDNIEKMTPITSATSNTFGLLRTPRHSSTSSNNTVDFVTTGGFDDNGFTTNSIETTKFNIPTQSVEFGELIESRRNLTSSSIG